jgi:hypothetical protein
MNEMKLKYEPEDLSKIAAIAESDGMKNFPDIVKVEVTVKMLVPGDWIAMVALWPDILSTDHIGSWARGVARDEKLGRLIWEFEKDERLEEMKGFCFIGDLHKDVENQLHAEAIRAWRNGEVLPKNYHRLDKEMAVRAFALMAQSGRHDGGPDWYGSGKDDAITYSVAIQLALFGEIEYD